MILPYYLVAVVLLCPIMGWLGFRNRTGIAALLAIPFIAYLVWLDAMTAGAPMLTDQFGLIAIAIVLGPYLIGLLAFFVGRFAKSLADHQTDNKDFR